MSAATIQSPPTAVYTTEAIYPLSVEQYHDLIDRGIFDSDDPVELINGLLVFKMPKNKPHIACVRRCRRAIEAVLPAGYFYDSEQPVTLPDGEPEPDGMIVHGNISDFDQERVKPADVALLIEIADSTLERDRGIKLRSYAQAGVGCYWIVNLIDRQVEVYTDPNSSAPTPSYRSTEVLKPGGAAEVKLDNAVIGQILVTDILPPVSIL